MNLFIKELDEAIGKLCEYNYLIDRSRHDYGSGFELRPPEIHALEMIGNHPDKNTTELAELLGISKGTFSKRTRYLESVHLLDKYQCAGNKKEIFYRLTELGRKAYEGHYTYHERVSNPYYKYFSKYTEEEKKLILDFIKVYTDYLKDYL